MTQDDAEAVAGWRYPAPHAFYDWTADPGDLAELLDAASRERGGYLAVDDEAGDLVGFGSCREDGGVVTLGLGLRPDHTGRGLGAAFLAALLDCARERFAPQAFALSVAAFNQRAITVYERAGFERVRVFTHATNGGEWEFVEMRRPA
jgi:ribosomal-protein-alanine N-acetyltransferase